MVIIDFEERIRQFRSTAGVQIMLDGAILASGQFLGLDTSGEFEKILARKTAVTDLAASVLSKRVAGASPGDIVAWLQDLVKQTPLPMIHEPGASATIATARMMLRACQARDEAGLYDSAETFPTQSNAKPDR